MTSQPIMTDAHKHTFALNFPNRSSPDKNRSYDILRMMYFWGMLTPVVFSMGPAQVFMKQFPLPPLRRLHVGLEARCTRSFHGCLQYLATVVSQTPHWRMVERDVRKSGLSRHAAANKFLRDSRKNKALLSRPFKSILEVFQFRVGDPIGASPGGVGRGGGRLFYYLT